MMASMNNAGIPRVIHYCWFGGNPLGPEEERCIESWRKYLPDYEIKRWDESNFDVRCCAYVSEAYDAKKWAFVSDYARFKIIYNEGGLYFDTDVEVIKPLDDIVAAGPFMGEEIEKLPSGSDRGNEVPAVAPGLGIASMPGSDLYREVLDSYETDSFVCEGDDAPTVVGRMTDILRGHGLEPRAGIQHVAGLTIYPPEYFCPMDMFTGKVTITENTRTIHHYKASWHTPSRQTEDAMRRKLIARGVNASAARHVARFVAIVRHLDFARIVNKIKKSFNHKHLS